jgi:hypothetical protein
LVFPCLVESTREVPFIIGMIIKFLSLSLIFLWRNFFQRGC